MARFIQGVTHSAVSPRTTDPLTDLTRLLSRLQQTVLRADAERERRLRTSEFERKRVEVNITYAQSLLTKLEQEALGVKILARRNELQVDLNRKRELLEELTERITDLAELSSHQPHDLYEDDDDDDEEDGSSDDILSVIMATPSASESMDSMSRSGDFGRRDESDGGGGSVVVDDIPEPPPPQQQPSPHPSYAQSGFEPGGEEEERSREWSEKEQTPQPTATTTTTQTTQTMRSRRPANEKEVETEKEKDGAAQTSSSAALFGGNRSITTSLSQTATAEAILDHQRAEQDALSESILKMARDLKQSSRSFASSLEEDKEVVAKAGEGLEKTETGLEAATRRMGTLRQMTEGKGWWGRMMLYAWIYGLMIVLVLVVFVLPKLRF
ncbi:synaptobrevin [Diplogelasinospora grovesii]|uniref:Synaptobrevin n=1 Tax=Diplogelasinospora grovesii TaxID=303347 RepID=A0AAN6S8D9_9PEZI|nr:synaptobrevin [Diplogelasinospora grovesii]